MKPITLKKVRAYTGVAGAFRFGGKDCIIMAKTSDDVVYVRSLITSVTGNPDVSQFKNVVLTASAHLKS